MCSIDGRRVSVDVAGLPPNTECCLLAEWFAAAVAEPFRLSSILANAKR